MSYEEAFQALTNRDFQTAAVLLERAALDTGYGSDIVNNAYTLALYHAGEKARLADVAFRVGNSLLEHDPGSAMDYFQRAMFAGLDGQRVRRIGGVFEKWAEVSPRGARLAGPVNHVAHIVGSLLPADARTQYLKMLVSSLKRQSIQSTIFTTESAAAWFFNPAAVPQSQPIEIEAEVKIGSVEGDFIERAGRVAEAVRATGIKIAFYHASLAELITARVASMRPAPVQVNVNHGAVMDADLFDGYIHLFRNGLERTLFSSQRTDWIPLASDIDTRLQTAEPITRQGIGLDPASTISATFGNLSKVAGSGYLRVLSEIMHRFPKHFHLFAGAGNVKAVRSHLHSEGVLPRVRFLGQVGDVAPLLDIIDVYLASFPESGGRSILEAMGAGKPVVVLRFAPDSHYNSGAEFVGLRELTAPREADYIEIADRLLRNPALRQRQGQAMLDRFRAEFRPERLGERYRAFLASFI